MPRMQGYRFLYVREDKNPWAVFAGVYDMSRNLCEVVCGRCNAEPTMVEQPREITRVEMGRYADEFRGMIVANAECPRCQARYLAWVDRIPHRRDPYRCEAGFCDLSYRSTFNDEPGEDDLPMPTILQDLDDIVAALAREGSFMSRDIVLKARRLLGEFMGGI